MNDFGVLMRTISRTGVSRMWRPRSSTPLIAAVALSQRRCASTGLSYLDERKKDRERVVILGSGWAGYTLARQLSPNKYQVVIVSPRSHFVFTPLLAGTAVGTLEFRTAVEPIRSKRTRRTNFVQGWANKVDLSNKVLQVEESVYDPRQSYALNVDDPPSPSDQKSLAARGNMFDLSYDKLIIAVGSYNQTFGIPGIKEHAFFLKDVGDARKIRKRILSCFESAALPSTTPGQRSHLLNFAIVGGGPTGIEFAGELHDLIHDDLSALYPSLMPYVNITVYDVAPTVLGMFDEQLSEYARKTFAREGIRIKTQHHVESLRRGPPGHCRTNQERKQVDVLTLSVKEQGEIGVGMVVWSTGLMANPFVDKALGDQISLPESGIRYRNGSNKSNTPSWAVKKQPKTGGLTVDPRLRLILQPHDAAKPLSDAVIEDVYALGDCATIENRSYPATAQVAAQEATWLAKRLNAGDIDRHDGFHWKNMGTLAYLGGWKALMQTNSGGHLSGKTAWIAWRGAYLTKSVSWRNKILIPIYWMLNWLFGRDISRF